AAPYVSTICATPLRLYSCRRDSGTTAIYTLSLHDALPISGADQRGLQRAGQFLKVALQVVEAGSGGLGRVALVVDVVDPLLDAGRPLAVAHARGPDRVVPEDLRERPGPGLLLQPAARRLQLLRLVGDADELPLRVVGRAAP